MLFLTAFRCVEQLATVNCNVVTPHRHGTKQGHATQSKVEPKTKNRHMGLKTGQTTSAESRASLRIGVQPEVPTRRMRPPDTGKRCPAKRHR
jgi:hypothetical protein